MPSRRDTAEIILGQLLVHHGPGAQAGLSITDAASPVEAMPPLLAERVEAALTAEPPTAAARVRDRKAGTTIARVIDIEEASGEMTGAAPVLPQAGLAAPEPFPDENGAPCRPSSRSSSARRPCEKIPRRR